MVAVVLLLLPVATFAKLHIDSTSLQSTAGMTDCNDGSFLTTDSINFSTYTIYNGSPVTITMVVTNDDAQYASLGMFYYTFFAIKDSQTYASDQTWLSSECTDYPEQCYLTYGNSATITITVEVDLDWPTDDYEVGLTILDLNGDQTACAMTQVQLVGKDSAAGLLGLAVLLALG